MKFVLPRSDEILICEDDGAAREAVRFLNLESAFSGPIPGGGNFRQATVATETHWVVVTEHVGREDGDNGFLVAMLPKSGFSFDEFKAAVLNGMMGCDPKTIRTAPLETRTFNN